MLNRLAIVVRNDAYDQLYTPLTFAYLAASQGTQVDILFVLWAVRVLTDEGAKSMAMDPRHAAEAACFKERLRRDGDPPTIHEFIKLLKHTGNVRFYGCRLAARTFDVDASHLVPEAEGIVDALWFVEEKATKADHCQYF
jgi:peroxiredoxin family protein